MNLLILSRDIAWLGGVVNFVAFLKCNYSDNVSVTDFLIGNRAKRRFLLFRYTQPLIDAVSLFMKVRDGSFDIVHINPSLNINSVLRDGLFALVLRFSRQRVLVFFHGWDQQLAKRVLDSRVLCFIMRHTFGKSSRILVLADGFREQLIDMGIDSERISTITTMFNGKQIAAVREPRDINGRRVLFLSRFVREKGMFELVEAFSRIAKEFPDARMVMAGDGPEKDKLEHEIITAGLEDKISLPGYVRDEEKTAVLLNTDIFVLPSYSEGCPVSMLEAMAAGHAIVSTTVGGIPDILQDSINGVLIDSPAPDLIYDALHRLMDSPTLLKKISETNKETAWRSYEAGVITSKIENYYHKAISDNA